jgi:hypothetical protein
MRLAENKKMARQTRGYKDQFGRFSATCWTLFLSGSMGIAGIMAKRCDMPASVWSRSADSAPAGKLAASGQGVLESGLLP